MRENPMSVQSNQRLRSTTIVPIWKNQKVKGFKTIFYDYPTFSKERD